MPERTFTTDQLDGAFDFILDDGYSGNNVARIVIGGSSGNSEITISIDSGRTQFTFQHNSEYSRRFLCETLKGLNLIKVSDYKYTLALSDLEGQE